jgi:DNA-binding FrmR family transcriptional regulator
VPDLNQLPDRNTPALIDAARSHLASAATSYTDPDKGLADVLTAIAAAQCALAAAATNLTRHMKG